MQFFVVVSSQWYAFYVAVGVDASAATTASSLIAFSTTPIMKGAKFRENPVRIEGSYTSNGDGVADTVTIADYTNKGKHMGRLMMVKAVGDANTTQLQLVVDGHVVWDFLKDGDTFSFELHDSQKIELIVNDPGGGTTTTVSYILIGVEEESVIVE